MNLKRGHGMTISERILRRVEIDASAGCWNWTGRIGRDGYGRIDVNGLSRLAHRIALEELRGPIQDGLQLDHLCRNKACVNPDHLEQVTARVNVLRGVGPSAVHARKTHCNHGHAFDEANTYYCLGTRHCRACNVRRTREHKVRKRQQP